MRTRLEAAVAHEILSEIKDQGRTLKWVQERSGVKPRAWNYYFKGDRPIPFQVLADVCAVLGVKASDVIARAEASAAAAPMTSAEVAEHALSQVSPAAQAAIRAVRDEQARDSEGGNGATGSLAN